MADPILENQADEEAKYEAQEHPVNRAILFEHSEDPGITLCPECDGRTFLLPEMRECPLCDGTGQV